jgi:hypothetical protein
MIINHKILLIRSYNLNLINTLVQLKFDYDYKSLNFIMIINH